MVMYQKVVFELKRVRYPKPNKATTANKVCLIQLNNAGELPEKSLKMPAQCGFNPYLYKKFTTHGS